MIEKRNIRINGAETEHWIDYMPIIPLDQGVPVAWPYNPSVKGVAVMLKDYTGEEWRWKQHAMGIITKNNRTSRGKLRKTLTYSQDRMYDSDDYYGWRVDLDHPQGWVYALRWYHTIELVLACGKRPDEMSYKLRPTDEDKELFARDLTELMKKKAEAV